MEVRLALGESIFVTIEDMDDSQKDGVRIEFNKNNQMVVTSSYEDDDGRQGEIYCATFDDEFKATPGKDSEGPDDRNEVIKTIVCSSCGEEFNFTKGEERFMKHVFKNNYRDPVRCARCRKIRMSRRRVEKEGE